MDSLTQAGAAKVEPKHRPSQRREDLSGVIHDLVMHGAAPERVGMAKQRDIGGIGFSLVEECLQAAGVSLQIERAETWHGGRRGKRVVDL